MNTIYIGQQEEPQKQRSLLKFILIKSFTKIIAYPIFNFAQNPVSITSYENSWENIIKAVYVYTIYQ